MPLRTASSGFRTLCDLHRQNGVPLHQPFEPAMCPDVALRLVRLVSVAGSGGTPRDEPRQLAGVRAMASDQRMDRPGIDVQAEVQAHLRSAAALADASGGVSNLRALDRLARA